MKQTTTTRKFNLIAVLTVCLLLVLSLFAFSFRSASAENTDDNGNWTEPLTIANSQFASADGSAPADPSNWTGASISGADASAIVSGVMDLSTYSSNVEAYKLKQYNLGAPDSPFGKVTNPSQPGYFEGTNRKVLLINANGTPTAYGYTSDEFTLNAYSYYRISVWTKTGADGANGGAAIVLTLDGEKKGFTGIKTKNLSNTGNYADGWFEYTFYISTDAVSTTSATLSLQLGYDDGGVGNIGGLSSEGFAMFDNVVAKQITSEAFYEATNSERTMVIDDNNAEVLLGGDFLAGASTFGETLVSGNAITSIANKATSNASEFGLESAITLPVERADQNAFIVSTFSNDEFKTGYGAIKSNTFTLDRFSYYRFSAWFYSESVEGGDGVSATIHYLNENAPAGTEFLTTSATSLVMDENAKRNHNGWTEISIFVKPSFIANYDAKLELSLGSEENQSSGVVMFDEITFERILPSVFSANTESADLTLDLSTILTDSTGITNGNMNIVGEFTDYDETPYLPNGWTKVSASEAGNDGYSKATVDTTDAVSGLVPVEDINSSVEGNGLYLKEYGNALKVSSTSSTVFAYRSSNFTATANGFNKLTANIFVEELNGYGASLVLKKDNKVLSTIEGIKETGAYSFYVKGANADSSLTLEIWMGQLDRVNNVSRQASGAFYVTEVKLATDLTEEIFNEKQSAYNSIRFSSNALGAKFAVADLSNSFSLFDSYNQNALKTPFGWTLNKGANADVNFGIVDTQYGNSGILSSTFDNEGKQYLFALNNIVPTASEVALDNAFTLAADKYYTLKVNAKVNLPEQNENAVGAFIRLSSADNLRFEFKDTSEKVEWIDDNGVDRSYNKLVYRTFTFYIKAPASETTTSLFVGMGGNTLPNERCSGWLYINDIALEEISAIDYDNACDSLKDDEVVINDYAIRADLTTADTETEEEETPEVKPSSDIAWWLIPSILLAVAVVLAVVGSFIRKAIMNRKPRRRASKTVERASYDRRNLLDSEAKKEDENNDVEDTFDEFDDNAEETNEEVTEETTEEVVDETAEEVVEEVVEEATEVTEGAPAESEEKPEGSDAE